MSWKDAPIVGATPGGGWKDAPLVGPVPDELSGYYVPDMGIAAEGGMGALKSLGRHVLDTAIQAPVGNPLLTALGVRIPTPKVAQDALDAMQPTNDTQRMGGRFETAAELIPAVMGAGSVARSGLRGLAGAGSSAMEAMAENPGAMAGAAKVAGKVLHFIPGGRTLGAAAELAPSVMARLRHLIGRAAVASPETGAAMEAAMARGTVPAPAPAPVAAAMTAAPATALADDVAAKVLQLQDAGLSSGQITSALKDTHGIPKGDAEKMVKMILDSKIPRPQTILPDGSRMMGTNYGGPQAPRPVTTDANLEDLLRQSIEQNKLKGSELISAKPLEAAIPDHNLPSDEGYVYHATNLERAEEIATSGRLKTHRPGDFTDQNVWPDGATEKRAYFSPKARVVSDFAPEEGRSVVLRASRDSSFISEGTGDVFSRKPISSAKLEILTSGGKWMSLLDFFRGGQ